jgi:hypothetical protein
MQASELFELVIYLLVICYKYALNMSVLALIKLAKSHVTFV